MYRTAPESVLIRRRRKTWYMGAAGGPLVITALPPCPIAINLRKLLSTRDCARVYLLGLPGLPAGSFVFEPVWIVILGRVASWHKEIIEAGKLPSIRKACSLSETACRAHRLCGKHLLNCMHPGKLPLALRYGVLACCLGDTCQLPFVLCRSLLRDDSTKPEGVGIISPRRFMAFDNISTCYMLSVGPCPV
jgi:hypothetical protein